MADMTMADVRKMLGKASAPVATSSPGLTDAERVNYEQIIAELRAEITALRATQAPAMPDEKPAEPEPVAPPTKPIGKKAH